MQPTVQTLLDRPELALSLLTPAPDLPAGALAAPIAWAHSSDLADPTPFLDAGHVLLTTGTQFEADARPASPRPSSPRRTCGACATRASPRSASAPR